MEKNGKKEQTKTKWKIQDNKTNVPISQIPREAAVSLPSRNADAVSLIRIHAADTSVPASPDGHETEMRRNENKGSSYC